MASSLVMGFFPLLTHALVLDFPSFSPPPLECGLPSNQCNWHNLAMSAEGQFTWDGQPVTLPAARALMIAGDNAPTGLSLDFSPAPTASYEDVLQMLTLIRADRGEGAIVYICGLDSARQFESPELNLAPPECTGALFRN